MGNQHSASHPALKPRKNVHWKSAGRPAAPGKPDIIPILSDDEPNAITLRWAASAHDGGAPLQGYQVECNRLGSAGWVRTAPPVVARPELVLTGLEPPHRYQFRVAAINAVGLSDYSELSDVLNVGSDRPYNEPPIFYQHLTDVTALENDKTEFRVSFSGIPAPTVSWFKDDYEIFSSRRTAITTTESSSVLVFHQTLPSDEGEIKCTATNRAGHAVSKARLALEAAPKLRYPRQYEDGLLYEINETVYLKMSIVGKPTPTVEWRHDGQPIAVDDRVEITNTPKFSMLKIHSARRSDRGEYQVHASNIIGEDTAAFLVTITAPPDPPRRVTVTRQVDKSITLDWEPPEDDGGCRIGNYVVEYYRGGWNVWLKATTSRKTNVTLFDLIEGSEYRFRVKAESPYGMSLPSVESAPVRIPGRSVDMEFLAVESRIINEVLTREDGDTASVSPAPRRKRAHAAPPSPQPKRRAVTPDKDPTGSNEFMLVLYPDKKQDDKAEKRKSFQLELEDALSPPPLSLSAPELSSRAILPFKALRNAVSSTELLHERAMARFYKAVAMKEEQTKNQKQNNQNTHIPYTTHDTNDSRPIEEQPIEEPKINPPQIYIKTDSIENKEYKYSSRLASNDSESSMSKWQNMSFDEDYTASTVSSDGEYSDEGSLNGEMDRRSQYSNEEDTYHPRDKVTRPSPSKEYLDEEEEDESEREALKPLPLPDPNFVPKPILKRREVGPEVKPTQNWLKPEEKHISKPQPKTEEKHTFGPQSKLDEKQLFGSQPKIEEKRTFGPQVKTDEKGLFSPEITEDKVKSEHTEKSEIEDRPLSPEPKPVETQKQEEKVIIKGKNKMERKADVFEKPKQDEKMTLFKKITKMPVQKPSFSFPKILQKKETEKPPEKNEANEKPKATNKVEKKKDEITEEGRTVIEYYDNIVREYKSIKKPSTPLYLNTEDLKHVAEEQEEKREKAAEQKKLVKQTKTTANKTTGNKQIADKSKIGNSVPKQTKSKLANQTEPKAKPKTVKRAKAISSKSDEKQNEPQEKYTQQIILKTTERATIVIPIDYQELEEQAKVNVRSAIDYMVDVCLLMLAFWVYFFKDERLAIPFLILIIYRQLQETILSDIPEWVRTHTPSWLKKKAS
ncbi:titin [Cydia amplana]|uniref:titin n=1 Tax=Cydia amplana TaxID=1869771 RepID=UPI002FE50549